MELRQRMSAVHRLFGFLTEFESLTPENVLKRAAHLVECYPEDLEPGTYSQGSARGCATPRKIGTAPREIVRPPPA